MVSFIVASPTPYGGEDAETKERTPCMQDVRSWLTASSNAYPEKDAFFVASFTRYALKDAYHNNRD